MSDLMTDKLHDDDVHVDEVAVEGDGLLGDVPVRDVEVRDVEVRDVEARDVQVRGVHIRDFHDGEDAAGQVVPIGEDQVREDPAADRDDRDLEQTIKHVIWTLRVLGKNINLVNNSLAVIMNIGSAVEIYLGTLKCLFGFFQTLCSQHFKNT